MEVDDALIKLITQIHGDTKSEDGTRVQSRANRTKLLELARQLVFLLEPPEDWIINQAFMSVINFAIRVLVELNVFKLLTKADGATMTVSQLASSTSADELLLTRCLRAACGVNFVDEVGVSEYRANKVTKALTMPGLEAGYQMIFDNQMRPKSLLWACLDYFREGGFVNPESATAGPLQIANDCVGWTAFDFWFSDPYPEEATRFSTWMQAVRGSRPLWVEWFPIQDLFSEKEVGQNEPLLVDVGGSHGTDIQAFALKFPDAQGKLFLQDRASVIQEAGLDLDQRITKQATDFFISQPVRGAKFYFMHMILHDWPDKNAKIILEHLRDAMTPGYSRILINDAILPDKDCPVLSAGFDMMMMVLHCAMERSENQWRTLIDSVEGLEIVKFWLPPSGEGILEVMRT